MNGTKCDQIFIVESTSGTSVEDEGYYRNWSSLKSFVDFDLVAINTFLIGFEQAWNVEYSIGCIANFDFFKFGFVCNRARTALVNKRFLVKQDVC